jgi:hypothetical protein
MPVAGQSHQVAVARRRRRAPRVARTPASRTWFWPGLTGCFVGGLVSTWSPPPAEGPLVFIWFLGVVTAGWIPGYLIWVVLNPNE